MRKIMIHELAIGKLLRRQITEDEIDTLSTSFSTVNNINFYCI